MEQSVSNISDPQEAARVPQLISDYASYICFLVLICGCYEVIGLFGIVTNSINIYIFSKLGFNDTINVSLLALTLSDFAGLLVLCWMGICYNPLFTNSDVHFDTLALVFLTGGRIKFLFSRISSMVTAYVAFERCLCIVLPLKVKTILTPKRAALVSLAIFVTSVVTIAPLYTTSYLDWKWYPDRNKTLLGLVFSKDRFHTLDVVHAINQVFTLGSYILAVFFTLILVVEFQKKGRWRKNITFSAEQVIKNASKEQAVVKMVIFISAVFIACFLPGNAASLTMIFEPEFNKGRGYHNLFTVVWAACHIVEGICASVNIFIYLSMSSKFRKFFDNRILKSGNREVMNTDIQSRDNHN